MVICNYIINWEPFVKTNYILFSILEADLSVKARLLQYLFALILYNKSPEIIYSKIQK